MSELGTCDEFRRLEDVELKEMICSTVLCRVKRQLVHEVELRALWLTLQDLSFHLHGKEDIASIKNSTAHNYDAHVNSCNVSHLVLYFFS